MGTNVTPNTLLVHKHTTKENKKKKQQWGSTQAIGLSLKRTPPRLGIHICVDEGNAGRARAFSREAKKPRAVIAKENISSDAVKTTNGRDGAWRNDRWREPGRTRSLLSPDVRAD